MKASEVKALASEAISCELGLIDWQATLDFLVDEHGLTDEERAKVDAKIQKMVHRLIVNL